MSISLHALTEQVVKKKNEMPFFKDFHTLAVIPMMNVCKTEGDIHVQSKLKTKTKLYESILTFRAIKTPDLAKKQGLSLAELVQYCVYVWKLPCTK